MFTGSFGSFGGMGGFGVVNNLSNANATNPYAILAAISAPISMLDEQISALLEQISSSPTPDQGDLLMLQMCVDQINNDFMLGSSCIKAEEDTQKSIISNIGS